MAKTTAPIIRFLGFTSPNYTQVPDELFDALMVELSGAELKVLLYIIRRTFGFKRDSDTISLSQMLSGLKTGDGRQLDRGVGLTKKPLLAALRSLAERGVILIERRTSAERGNEPTSYRLNIRTGTADQEEKKTPPPLGEKLPQALGGEIPPSPRGSFSPTQETERKTDFSNLRKAVPMVENDATRAGQQAAPGRSPATPTGTAPPPSRGGAPEAIKATLGRLQQRLLPAEPEAREAVAAYITEFASELGDRAPLKSSITRAVHLYQQSGRSLASFLDRLHQARAIVRERTSAPTSKPITNRMSYFFRVLEDNLGLAPANQTPELPVITVSEATQHR